MLPIMSRTAYSAFSPANLILGLDFARKIDRESSGKIGHLRAFSGIVGHESGMGFQDRRANPHYLIRNAIFGGQDLEKCPITQGGISDILGHQPRFYANIEGAEIVTSSEFRVTSKDAVERALFNSELETRNSKLIFPNSKRGL